MKLCEEKGVDKSSSDFLLLMLQIFQCTIVSESVRIPKHCFHKTNCFHKTIEGKDNKTYMFLIGLIFTCFVACSTVRLYKY